MVKMISSIGGKLRDDVLDLKAGSIDPDKDLPAISILLSVRDEAVEIKQTIQMILNLEYPKKEVIVVDDCSQDETPQIIKTFARQGVRFIKSSPPKGQELGTVSSTKRLLDEASGEYCVLIESGLQIDDNNILMKIFSGSLSKKSALYIDSGYQFSEGWLKSLATLAIEPWPLRPMRSFQQSSSIMIASRKELLSYTAGNTKINQNLNFFQQYIKDRKIKATRVKNHGVSKASTLSSTLKRLSRSIHPTLGRSTAASIWTIVGLVSLGVLAFRFGISLIFSINLLSFTSLLFIFLAIYLFFCIEYENHFLLRTILSPLTIVVLPPSILLSLYLYKTSKITWRSRNICFKNT